MKGLDVPKKVRECNVTAF